MDGFELGLLSKGSHVACHESRIFQTFAGHLCDFCELGIPSLLVVGELGFLSWVAVVGVAGMLIIRSLLVGACRMLNTTACDLESLPLKPVIGAAKVTCAICVRQSNTE
jgi:hypothetical protein